MHETVYPAQEELEELNENIVKKFGGELGIISSERISETIEEMKKARGTITKALY